MTRVKNAVKMTTYLTFLFFKNNYLLLNIRSLILGNAKGEQK